MSTVSEARKRLIRGTYWNVPATSSGLCVVCTAPTTNDSYQTCYPCTEQQRSGKVLASGGVYPLMWAPMQSQGYQDLRQYKESSATPDQIGRLKALFALALTDHKACLIPRYKEPFAVAHVPSTSGTRTGTHPLEQHILSMLSATRPRIVPRYVGPSGPDKSNHRRLDPDAWVIPDMPADIHRAILIDDTWVTGSRAQSVASALEARGINTRIIVLGRALDPSRRDHSHYLDSHSPSPYNTDICPVFRSPHCAEQYQ